MPNSPNSVIPANDGLIKACAEAVEELKAARFALQAQGSEIKKQRELLILERQISNKAKDINKLSESEKRELRAALLEKDKILLSKDKIIEIREAENKELKKQKLTFWKTVRIAIVGVAAGVVIGKVF